MARCFVDVVGIFTSSYTQKALQGKTGPIYKRLKSLPVKLGHMAKPLNTLAR